MCVNPKYNIRRRLLKMSGNYRDNLYELCIKVDRSLRAVEKWIEIEKGSKSSIPVDQFYIIAEFFHCNPSDLING